MCQSRSSVYDRFSISFFCPQGLWFGLLTAVVTQVIEQRRGYLLKKLWCFVGQGVKHQELVFMKRVDESHLTETEKLAI